MKMIATALAVLLALPAAAECYKRDHLAAYLKVEHGLALHSWGLDDAGNMVELFLGAGGHWAVVQTTPTRCSSVAMPHKARGRLSDPVPQNKINRPGLRMSPGEAG